MLPSSKFQLVSNPWDYDSWKHTNIWLCFLKICGTIGLLDLCLYNLFLRGIKESILLHYSHIETHFTPFPFVLHYICLINVQQIHVCISFPPNSLKYRFTKCVKICNSQTSLASLYSSTALWDESENLVSGPSSGTV